MSNEQELPEPVDQPLASEPPDPSGPPQPVTKGDPMLGLLTAGGVTLVAAGGLFAPVFLGGGHTAGATRSAKIEWENRQQQVEQALLEEQADLLAETPTEEDE